MTSEVAVTEGRTADGRMANRRARFREAVARLSDRAQSAELVRLLLFPGALAVVGGFGFMLLGWYGASHTPRQIEQLPYLISGGLIGLGLVFVGALLLSSAVWMTMLRQHQEEIEERTDRRLLEMEERLRAAAAPKPATRARKAAR